MNLVIIGDSDSTGKAMLHDMRVSYIRRERPRFRYDAPPSYREVAFFAACLGVFAALLYLRFKWGVVIRLNEAAVLFAP
ncbi:MAG TPA: hypothetical protein VNR65_01125 [Geobacterales bacterium]|jgi:hypothetical protein|nr:hypothetical protein [Geobacterales bacterium]